MFSILAVKRFTVQQLVKTPELLSYFIFSSTVQIVSSCEVSVNFSRESYLRLQRKEFHFTRLF